MIRILLFIMSGILLIGPIMIWLLLSGMSCAYVTAATECGVKWKSLLDPEFYSLSALPWLIGIGLFYIAIQMNSKKNPDK